MAKRSVNKSSRTVEEVLEYAEAVRKASAKLVQQMKKLAAEIAEQNAILEERSKKRGRWDI